jgi:hypothetical protein
MGVAAFVFGLGTGAWPNRRNDGKLGRMALFTAEAFNKLFESPPERKDWSSAVGSRNGRTSGGGSRPRPEVKLLPFSCPLALGPREQCARRSRTVISPVAGNLSFAG